MGGYTCALSATDLVIGYKWGYPLRHQHNLESTPEDVRLEIYSES